MELSQRTAVGTAIVTIVACFPHAFTSGLVPCLTIALGMLYYGGKLVATEE